MATESPLFPRSWIDLIDSATDMAKCKPRFSVLQFNLLAQSLTSYSDFIKAPAGSLDWEYRRQLLLQEILRANADILCFQECDESSYFAWFAPQLTLAGYQTRFLKKPSDKSEDGLVFGGIQGSPYNLGSRPS